MRYWAAGEGQQAVGHAGGEEGWKNTGNGHVEKTRDRQQATRRDMHRDQNLKDIVTFRCDRPPQFDWLLRI